VNVVRPPQMNQQGSLIPSSFCRPHHSSGISSFHPTPTDDPIRGDILLAWARGVRNAPGVICQGSARSVPRTPPNCMNIKRKDLQKLQFVID